MYVGERRRTTVLPEAPSLGFFDASRAQNVSRIIGKTERLVATIGLPPSDLECAEEALRVAKALYAVHDFSEAVAQARRAGALAVSLNDRFNAYVSAWKGLQNHIAELEQLGFPTAELEDALGEAEEAMAHLVEEEGAVVPDYLGATARIERAAGEARAALVGARRGSREIFLATLATEALSEADSSEAASLVVGRLAKLIERATEELAQGHVFAAADLASEARGQADEILIGADHLHDFMGETEAFLEDLDSEDTGADEPAADLASAVRVEPVPPRASEGADQVPDFSDEAVAFIDRFARAQKLLERAERVRNVLQREGLLMSEADEFLLAARRAADAGDWEILRRNLRRATQIYLDRRNERAGLDRGILDLDTRLTQLKDFHLPLLPTVHEALERAKEAFRSGRLLEAGEQLASANTLMTQATRTGS